MSDIVTMYPVWRNLIFYRIPGGVHFDYVTVSAIDHLRKFGRITLYYVINQQQFIRHHTNVFVVPSFINDLPMNQRLYFVDNIIQILRTIPLHKPLHIDLNDYPEFFI